MSTKVKTTKAKNSYLLLDDQDEEMLTKTALGDKHSIRILYSFSRPYRTKIVIALIIMLLSSVFAIVSSRLMGDLIEKGLVLKKLNTSVLYASTILFLEFGSMALIYFSRKSLGDLASKIIFSIRQELFLKLQNLPMSYYDRQPQGRIVTRITSDVEGIEDFFTSSLGNLLSAIMTTILALVAMLVSDFKLGALMIVAIVPSVFLMYYTKDLLRDSNRLVSKHSSAINSKLSEYLSGIDIIRGLGLENFTNNEFKKTVDGYLKAQLRGNFLFAWSMPLVIFCASIPLIGLVWFGGMGFLSGTISLGLFISFVRYFERFFNPMMLISREIHVVQQAFTSLERVMGFLNEDDEDKVLKNLGNMHLEKIEGDIKFIDVSMSYGPSSPNVLKNLNFHIRSGEKIGLVGRTGCGKSTTVSLLTRLYEYNLGEILVDDISIRNIDRHYLRKNIGFVLQDAVIFKGSLRMNLSSSEDITDQELIDAAKTTGLFKAFSKGGFNLDLEIYEGGVNLSVGERQLISLTRVLLNNPSILVLDEATANIDPYFEGLISNAINIVMKGRTCLIIAHRLDTLKECDRIFVFSEGSLVEQGPLEELINQKNYFYGLHYAQSIH